LDNLVEKNSDHEKNEVVNSQNFEISSTRKRLLHAHKYHQDQLKKKGFEENKNQVENKQEKEESLNLNEKKTEVSKKFKPAILLKKFEKTLNLVAKAKNEAEKNWPILKDYSGKNSAEDFGKDSGMVSKIDTEKKPKKNDFNKFEPSFRNNQQSKNNAEKKLNKGYKGLIKKRNGGILNHFWDIVLTIGLTTCFIMVGFLGFQNQGLQVEQNKQNFAINNLDLDFNQKIAKEFEKTVYIRRKIDSQNMKNISQNLQKRTTDLELKNILQANEAADFWETIGQGIVVDENFIIVPKQLVITGGDFEAKQSDEIKKMSLVAIHPFEDLALFELESGFANSNLNLQDNLSIGEKVYLKSPTNFASKGLSVGNVGLKEANMDAIFSNSIQESLVPKPLQQAINKQNNLDLYKKAFAQNSLSHNSGFVYNAPVLFVPIGSPIFNQNGDFLGMHSGSLQRPDTATFVVKDTVDFNVDLGAEQAIKDVALEGVSLGSSFQFNLAVSTKAIKELINSYKNSGGIVSLPINGREIDPAISAFVGINKVNQNYGFFVNSVGAKEKIDEKNYPIKKGDILLEVDKEKVSQNKSFGQLIGGKKISQILEIKLLRKQENVWKEETIFVNTSEVKMQSGQDFFDSLKS